VLDRGYESMVAKDETRKYVGGRTRAWLKIKQDNRTEGEHRWRRTLGTSRTPTTHRH
jgi:ATP-dependent DNA ligase